VLYLFTDFYMFIVFMWCIVLNVVALSVSLLSLYLF